MLRKLLGYLLRSLKKDNNRLFKRERVLQYCVEAEGRDVWIGVRVEDEVLPEGGEED